MASPRTILVAAALASVGAAELCKASVDGAGKHTFNVHFDPFSSELGAFKFLECGDEAMPTLAMERGVTYTFSQEDVTNWFHPMGFGYGPDGAHKDNDELEPGLSRTNSACVDAETCQAPRYFNAGVYLGGSYDNSGSVLVGGDDFGLDFYEPAFFATRAAWAEAGAYTIDVTLTDADYEEDLFYFCHIHNSMSGRIKIMAGDEPVNAFDSPPLGYAYDVVSAYDAECGTVGLDAYQSGKGKCSTEFVCLDGTESSAQQAFAGCLYSMDCAMQSHMKSTVHDTVPIVTFIHQMVPHHQNAVNMAKALLKTNTMDAENEDDAEMTNVLWAMINEQNYQIHVMRSYLETKGYQATGACATPSDSLSIQTSDGATPHRHPLLTVAVAVAVSLILIAAY
ncbi:hypothetical protein M885DRAFT_616650 [Pelagophyceae sp. CCMP2097]|nr:hypothetical protein M885DRAFT_616650 [Pelagophyceae sp. CCMP2097]